MGKIVNFDQLIEDGDIPGLVAILRDPDDADLRETAAHALADLGDVSAVEALIRSHLQDPDLGVRKAARKALDLVVGSDAGLAISTFGPLPPDPWLVERGLLDWEEEEEEEEPYQADLDAFIEEHDLEGLVACLRHPRNSDLRLAAAEALGELGDPQAIEYLIRANIEDPDPEVRQAAYDALEGLSGANASLAVAAYQSGPRPRDAWLVEPDPGLILIDEDEQDDEPAEENEEDQAAYRQDANNTRTESYSDADLDGLVRIVAGEPDLQMRLKAIRALQQIHDMRSVDILTYSALHGDVPVVRKAARQALYEIFGQDAAGVIKSYQQSDEEAGADADEEDEEEIAEDEKDSDPSGQSPQAGPGRAYPVVSFSKPDPVIQEERTPWWLLAVGAGILLLVILLLLFIK